MPVGIRADDDGLHPRIAPEVRRVGDDRRTAQGFRGAGGAGGIVVPDGRDAHVAAVADPLDESRGVDMGASGKGQLGHDFLL